MYRRFIPFVVTLVLFVHVSIAQDSTQQADDSDAILMATAEAIAAAFQLADAQRNPA